MQQEKPFSELESIALIESMINKARNRFSEGGHLYLLWGWVIFVCSVGQFILMNVFQYKYNYAIWFITWIAFLYQMRYMFRKNKKRKVKTYTDSLIGYVWLAFIISMFVIAFVIGSRLGSQAYIVVYSVFLVAYGVPSFLSGTILRFKPLIFGGLSCWSLALISAFIPAHYHLLLIGAAMILAWIVPGYLLQSKFKTQTQYYG